MPFGHDSRAVTKWHASFPHHLSKYRILWIHESSLCLRIMFGTTIMTQVQPLDLCWTLVVKHKPHLAHYEYQVQDILVRVQLLRCNFSKTCAVEMWATAQTYFPAPLIPLSACMETIWRTASQTEEQWMNVKANTSTYWDLRVQNGTVNADSEERPKQTDVALLQTQWGFRPWTYSFLHKLWSVGSANTTNGIGKQ